MPRTKKYTDEEQKARNLECSRKRAKFLSELSSMHRCYKQMLGIDILEHFNTHKPIPSISWVVCTSLGESGPESETKSPETTQ